MNWWCTGSHFVNDKLKGNKIMLQENFTKEELEIARLNGFILIGRIGAGKSTLINILFNEEVAEVKISPAAVTKESKIYYLKLKNGRYISLIDTPGISDIFIKNIDYIFSKDILKTIFEEKIQIQGILFLINFQTQRFSCEDQDALIFCHHMFPFKSFWKHLIVIFTHYENDDSEGLRGSNNFIFSKLIERTKNVSDAIDYRELKIKYYNSYLPVKSEKRKIINNKNREDLEILINDFCQKEPLFSQKEIIYIKNEKIEEEKEEGSSKCLVV